MITYIFNIIFFVSIIQIFLHVFCYPFFLKLFKDIKTPKRGIYYWGPWRLSRHTTSFTMLYNVVSTLKRRRVSTGEESIIGFSLRTLKNPITEKFREVPITKKPEENTIPEEPITGDPREKSMTKDPKENSIIEDSRELQDTQWLLHLKKILFWLFDDECDRVGNGDKLSNEIFGLGRPRFYASHLKIEANGFFL